LVGAGFYPKCLEPSMRASIRATVARATVPRRLAGQLGGSPAIAIYSSHPLTQEG